MGLLGRRECESGICIVPHYIQQLALLPFVTVDRNCVGCKLKLNRLRDAKIANGKKSGMGKDSATCQVQYLDRGSSEMQHSRDGRRGCIIDLTTGDVREHSKTFWCSPDVYQSWRNLRLRLSAKQRHHSK